MKILRLSLLILLVVLASFVCTQAYADTIAGKISLINAKEDTMEISGVRIFTANAKIENSSGQPMKLSDLEAEDSVYIKGNFNSSGDMFAENVTEKTIEYGEIQGEIQNLNQTDQELTISGTTVIVPISAVLLSQKQENIPLNMFIRGFYVTCTGEWTGDKELTAVKVETRY